ncbi:MAG: glycosyltransferase family 2 protein [Pseudomonadales bacterium]|jgi:GT2 family glycosyltransferase|nr:glycosyltransferase family 2 protein [Pseudomonadales bacterium]
MIAATRAQDNTHDDTSACHLDARPLVSVCIANYNGEAFIRECLDSVLNQTGSPSFEIIVHDDASTDGSLDQITSYPMVRVIRSATNVGYCVANNRMATVARGAYLLLLNNDAVLEPDALSTLMASATTMATPAILGLRQYDYHSRNFIDAGAWLDLFMSPIPIRRDEPTHPAMVIGACLWIPHSLWDELGGFPEWFHTNAEDVYLCCAARMRGYDIFVPNVSGYLHRVGATLSNRSGDSDKLTTTIRRRYLSERNRTRLMLIFYPWPLLIVALMLHLSTLLIEGIVVAAANRDSNILIEIYMHAMRDVEWRSLQLSAARRQVAATRQIPFYAFLSRFRVIPSKIRSVVHLGLPRVR